VLVSFSRKVLFASDTVQHPPHLPPAHRATIFKALESKYTYGKLTLWNRSLCSARSDRRGSHQKVISISVYGPASKHTDNLRFAWDVNILPFLEQLAREVQLLEPSWVIRLYTDFTGSTHAQRELLSKFSNVDVCNMSALPLFGSTLLTFLPGKFWRFVAVFDPLVDYFLSRDLDSPITRRETETIDLWTSDQHQDKFFHIARDHDQHGVPILGGLLVPSIARNYTGAGDQTFLEQLVWDHVKNDSLIFDSYFCQLYGGQPFLSQQIDAGCHLGCIRPCCDIVEVNYTNGTTGRKPCPAACRPKDHSEWTYC
jgi:hypothetical protein